MTEEHLRALLAAAATEVDDEGWHRPTEGRSIALHLAHDGVGLVVGRISCLRVTAPWLVARTMQGEEYVLCLEDVFAGAVEGQKGPGRKAGFV
jgi:hypothetical protein